MNKNRRISNTNTFTVIIKKTQKAVQRPRHKKTRSLSLSKIATINHRVDIKINENTYLLGTLHII
jgi:hypothetical protein